MDWKQKLEAKAAARAAARAAEEEKGLSNNEIKVLRQAKAQANADAHITSIISHNIPPNPLSSLVDEAR